MKINKLGLTFSYHGDELTYLWPWKRIPYVRRVFPQESTRKDIYFSAVFNQGFTSLRDYWQFVGVWNEACRKEKIIGYTEKEILLGWAKYEFRHNIVILLTNINVEMKSTVFWKSVDIFARKQLLKDVAVLFFHNERDAKKVMYSIPAEFANADLIVRGRAVEDNVEQAAEDYRGNDPGPL
jgi:hypothetical protein